MRDIAIAGGVSANSELRRRLREISSKEAFALYTPRLEYCTDNGAMVALVGWMKLRAGLNSDFELNALASVVPEKFLSLLPCTKAVAARTSYGTMDTKNAMRINGVRIL